ncbi:MAG: tetratricopeptide repeat protein [Gemmatimonadetes bacterium]|jgi:tetratricopeptide (TPR) repeat protein|nr:tetratricopeptide repeat protein [Gemmatimonadota bacterium]MBT6147403.1 tetratricopeptide repeat protein [Gemmatimonadota bacterium]MBT7864624.1 tetratricopeptide repeat protein [Gemmatimonadota bacterium]
MRTRRCTDARRHDAAGQVRRRLPLAPLRPGRAIILAAVLALGACSSPAEQHQERDRSYALADSFMASRQYTEAREAYQQTIRLDPAFLDARCDLGDLNTRLGLMDEAEVAYRQTLAIDSSHVRALHNLSVIRADLGYYAEAITLLERAVATPPQSPAALQTLALFYSRQGHDEEAEAALGKALDVAPDLAGSNRQLGELYLRLGRYSEADEFLQKAAELGPGNAENWLNLGLLYLRQGQASAALPHFKKALEMDPHHAEGHYYMASVLQKLGKTEAAEQLMQRFEELSELGAKEAKLRGVLDGDPENIGAHLELALHYQQTNRPQKALRQLRTVLVFAPDHLDALHVLSNLHLRLGNQQDALRVCQQAIDQHPLDPQIYRFHFIVGYIHLAAQRLGQAESAFQQALEQRPDFAKGWNNMGNLQLMKGDLSAAGQAFARALEADPHFVEARYNMAMIMARQGDLEGARRQLLQTVASDSTFATAHFVLGGIYEQQDSLAAAIGAYQRFLDHWQGDPETARKVRLKLAELR